MARSRAILGLVGLLLIPGAASAADLREIAPLGGRQLPVRA